MTCPDCGEPLPKQEGPCLFCSKCGGMSLNGESLTSCDGRLYNFCDSGFFSLLGPALKKGTLQTASFKAVVRPVLHRILSHCIWIALWISLWAFFPLGYVAMFFIFVSATLLFSYVTLLYLRSAIKPLFFPPPWEQVVMWIEKGQMKAAESWVKESNLQDHPGIAANLAVGYHRFGHHDQAGEWLSHARALCPAHPALKALDLTPSS